MNEILVTKNVDDGYNYVYEEEYISISIEYFNNNCYNTIEASDYDYYLQLSQYTKLQDFIAVGYYSN